MSKMFNLLEMFENLQNDWKHNNEFMEIVKRHALTIKQVDQDPSHIYPPTSMILKAFELCSFDNLKVVILGQDPYHSPNMADGLCFSSSGTKVPLSLQNVFKELNREYGRHMRKDANLSDWAEQGVLLLNRALTVRQGTPLSHMQIWSDFTKDVVEFIAKQKSGVVYMLWGKSAQSILKNQDMQTNLVLNSVHPSPLAQIRFKDTFIGNEHFSKCNNYLQAHGKQPIDWLGNMSPS